MSESDIDMDRAMQGIDCEVPKITWTNCADKRPPYDPIIIKDMRSSAIYRTHGEGFLLCQRERSYGFTGSLKDYEWTPYTPEKWKELNK